MRKKNMCSLVFSFKKKTKLIGLIIIYFSVSPKQAQNKSNWQLWKKQIFPPVKKKKDSKMKTNV